MDIWIVQGTHPSQPGCPISAFFNERSAHDEAANLVRIIQRDCGLPKLATTVTWVACLVCLQVDHECDVWISKVEPKD